MRVCPGCRTTYDESVQTCPKDGLPLLDVSPTFAALRKDGEEDPLPPASDTAVKAGMMIGEFRVERTIAEGGMGAIYAAIHPVISKRVAVKVLNKRFAQDPKAVGRFVLEARSVNQIGHHCIVDIFSIGELDDGRNYLVMELLDGPALHQILPRVKRFRPGELVPVYEQLCDALMAAHEKGFVHRDLKPDNVIVLRRPPRPQIKILDFGIAKLRGAATDSTSENTEVGTVLGTPEYMSPEQCRGSDVDARTDIYALGVMLYELVTGRKPFTDPSPMRILTMQLRDQPIPPSRIAPIPKALELVILRAMAKSPAERQSNAKLLFDEIRAAVPQALPWSADLSFHTETQPPKKKKPAPKADQPTPVAARPPAPRALDVPAPISMTGTTDAVSNEEVDDESATMVADSPPTPEITAPVPPPVAGADGADDVTRPVLTPEARASQQPLAARATAAQASGDLAVGAAGGVGAAGAMHRQSFRERAQQRAPRKRQAPPAPLAIAGHGTGELDAEVDTNVADSEHDTGERTEVAPREAVAGNMAAQDIPARAFETPPPRELSDMAESTLVDDEPPVAVLVSRPLDGGNGAAKAKAGPIDHGDGSSPNAGGERRKREIKRPPPPEPIASRPMPPRVVPPTPRHPAGDHEETREHMSLPPTAPVPLLDRKLAEPGSLPAPSNVPRHPSAGPPPPSVVGPSGPMPRPVMSASGKSPAVGHGGDIGNAATLVPGAIDHTAMLVDRPLTEDHGSSPGTHRQAPPPPSPMAPGTSAVGGYAAGVQSRAPITPASMEAPPLRPPQPQQPVVQELRPISNREPAQPAHSQARKQKRRIRRAPLIIGIVAILAAIMAVVLVLLLPSG
ncbi:MAG: serine/threonine protein kinase [Myxococcales bacterium]|nr:serine/threonine protein kinase [Myxococcales bacterium]